MHPAKFYLIFVLLPQLLIAPFFAFRPERSNFRWTNYTFFTFITLLSLFAILDPHLKSEIPDIDPVLGTAVGGSLFNALHMLLLVDPLMDYRHTTDVFDSTKELPWWKRIYWAACANFAIRGIDWNFQVPHIVTQKHRNRPTFVFYALSRTLIFFILSDVAQYLGSKLRSEDSALGKSKLTFQIIRTICWGMEDFASLSRLYYCVAILSVLGHLSSPDEWPPLFGSWSEAYCLRNFWGKTWHQLIRRLCVSPGHLIVRRLGLPPRSRSTISGFVKLYTAFLVSAIIHSFGDYRANRLGTSFTFFMLQPIGITLEEVVKGLWWKSRSRKSQDRDCTREDSEVGVPSRIWIVEGRRRMTGYIWVLIWFTATVPLHKSQRHMNEKISTDLDNQLSFSFVMWLIRSLRMVCNGIVDK